MTIQSILTEWTYRLPKGYPTNSTDYDVLREVLDEMTDLSPTKKENVIRSAQGLPANIVTEEIDIDSIDNQDLLDQIAKSGKTNEFTEFLRLLPTGANNITINYLNRLSAEKAGELADILYSKQSITEESLNQIDYQTGIISELFNLDTSGLGKGEILLAVLVRSAQIQGGIKSYDLVSNGQKYEIKDYTKRANASIRLGTKSSVTRFKFWDEITTTFKRISQLQGIESPKFNFTKYFNAEFLKSIDYLNDRRSFIMAGNLNLQDKRVLEQFYLEAHKLNSEIQGYTNLILRGPNALPIEMSIEPIQNASDKIVITPIQDTSEDITYINTELRRIKYVRNPELLNVDLQNAVDEVVGDDLLFIVFRNAQVNVTTDFRYYVIDAGRIRIVEKSILPTQINDNYNTELVGE
jgi:hypothetical protein